MASLLLLIPSGVPAHEEILLQIADVSRRLEAQPGDPDLLLRRGRLHLDHQDPSAARADCDRALAAAPDRLEPLIYRGLAYRAQGDLQRALADLDRFVSVGPPYVLAHEARADARAEAGDRVGAAADWAAAARLRPKPEHYLRRARLLKDMGDAAAASACCREGLSRLGSPAALVLELVTLETGAGRYDEALRLLASLESQAGRPERWILRRAEVLDAAGRPDEARAARADALARLDARVASGRATPLTLLDRARALESLGRREECRSALDSLPPFARGLEEYRELEKRLEGRRGESFLCVE